MTTLHDNEPEDLKRIPGLYRRWELAEILAACRCYRIEDAGRHSDGTPLLALYIGAPDGTARSRHETISGNAE